MGNPAAKRRRDEENVRRPKKKIKNFKKQTDYHSSSESDDDAPTSRPTADFVPVSMEDSDGEKGAKEVATELKSALKATSISEKPAEEEESVEQEDADEGDDLDMDDLEMDDGASAGEDLGDEFDLDQDSDASSSASNAESEATGANRTKRKRNDPTAFANSINKILSSKLTTSKRSDPVLSRSATASAASRELTDAKLEAKAKKKLHAEKRQALERGRVRDVMGLESTDISTADIQEQEKRLKKTAQRGVVKLFNAVRAAQVQGDLAREEARKQGIVGMAQREERVSEMSKKGFLDLIASGGKKAPAMNVQEA